MVCNLLDNVCHIYLAGVRGNNRILWNRKFFHLVILDICSLYMGRILLCLAAFSLFKGIFISAILESFLLLFPLSLRGMEHRLAFLCFLCLLHRLHFIGNRLFSGSILDCHIGLDIFFIHRLIFLIRHR